MFISDLHLHSTFSDGRLSIPEIVDLYGSRGFGAISVTDHLCETNTLMGKASAAMNRTLTPAVFPLYMEILKSEARRAWDRYRMVLIPGIELTKNSMVSHSSARILALGVTDYIEADADVVTLARAVRAQGAVAVASHTQYLWGRRDELAGEFDAWEISAGRKLHREVLGTALPKLAASGMHHPRHILSWKTMFFCERSPDAILEAIRRQELCFAQFDKSGIADPAGWIQGAGALGVLGLRFRPTGVTSGAAEPSSIRNERS
jgi:hypothetical protein